MTTEEAPAVERVEAEIAVHDECWHEGMIGHGFVQVRYDDLRTLLRLAREGLTRAAVKD